MIVIIMILNFKFYLWEFHTCMQQNMVTTTSYPLFSPPTPLIFSPTWSHPGFFFFNNSINSVGVTHMYMGYGAIHWSSETSQWPLPQNRMNSSSVRVGICRSSVPSMMRFGSLDLVQGLCRWLQLRWAPGCNGHVMSRVGISQISSHPPALTFFLLLTFPEPCW